MSLSDEGSESMMSIQWSFLVILTSALTGCGSEIADHARNAESEGSTISNEMMTAMYPETFRPGTPAYLERDFEAGADLICDEIERNHGRDICAEPDINWR